MICPDTFRKVMFSNPSPLRGWSEVEDLFQNSFLLGIEWNVQFYTGNSYFTKPYLQGYGVGANLQKNLFPMNYIICPCLHIGQLWQHNPMDMAIMLKGQLIKHSLWEFNWNAKLMFSIHPLPQGVWAQFAQRCFAENTMKWPNLHRNYMFGNLHPMGKGIGHIPKNECLMEIAWTVQNCINSCFLILHITTKGWRVRANAENNAMSSTKMLVNFSQPYPTWKFTPTSLHPMMFGD